MPIDRSLLGTHTRHGIMPGPRGYVGAKINQDRGVVYWPYNNSFNEALFCVFDGHGSRGEKVAEICMEQIPLRLEADHAKLRDDPGGVLTSTVVQFDRELLSGSLGPYAHTCGTTSIIVYIRGGACWTACSGDSRAVLGRLNRGRYEAVDLSEDCKPDTPAEMERIHAAGGTVSPAQGGRPSRVWANGRIGLAMSRSIGDGECKRRAPPDPRPEGARMRCDRPISPRRYGVIPDPEIKRFELQPAADGARDGDKFIIVASDGVWEFISSAEAVDIVAASGDASNACAELVQKAALRWKVNEGNYRDDITAIVAYLPFLQPSWDEEEEPTPEVRARRSHAAATSHSAAITAAGGGDADRRALVFQAGRDRRDRDGEQSLHQPKRAPPPSQHAPAARRRQRMPDAERSALDARSPGSRASTRASSPPTLRPNPAVRRPRLSRRQRRRLWTGSSRMRRTAHSPRAASR